jgi:exopolysaccharide biosynthesis WecB/TagA/CpsF family protein
MELRFRKLDLSNFRKYLNSAQKWGILYCDFNVANFLVGQQLKVPDNIILYPDSTFIHLILRFFLKIKIKKIVSTDIQDQILEICNQEKLKLFLFGDKEEVLKKVIENFKIEYPHIHIAGFANGYKYNNKDILKAINRSKPDLVLVALGAGRQERWIIENIDYIYPSIIILSVGGYFRFKSGVKKRAPDIWRKLNTEWLYRLLTEFRTVGKRYSFGGIKFLFNIITRKINLIYIENDSAGNNGLNDCT